MRDAVEDASIQFAPFSPILWRSSATEQILESQARIACHRQRRGRRRPTDGIHVSTAVVVATGTGRIQVLNTKLDRRQWRVLTEFLCIHLVNSGAVVNIGAFGLLRMACRKKHN